MWLRKNFIFQAKKKIIFRDLEKFSSQKFIFRDLEKFSLKIKKLSTSFLKTNCFNIHHFPKHVFSMTPPRKRKTPKLFPETFSRVEPYHKNVRLDNSRRFVYISTKSGHFLFFPILWLFQAKIIHFPWLRSLFTFSWNHKFW